MNRIRIPADLVKVNDIFKKNGYKAYLVGGAVRDILRKKEGHDWDLATNATPEQVMKMFHRVIPTGIAHGTVTIHIFGHDIETTTFRTESSYSDGRHPDKVAYAATIEEDLSRRDFTINAIAADLETGDLVDPFGGQEDIKKKIIRTVGSPLERFDEDGLRPVRAVRFAGQLDFTIEESTLKAISEPAVLKKTASVSVERFREEWCKMLLTENPGESLRLLEETGILEIFIPEFKDCRGCMQHDARGFHDFDVADHLFYACDGATKDSLIVRLAAFFHDIGKPDVRSTEIKDGVELIHFHKHEVVSEKKCRTIMTRLKFPNETINRVCHLVREHMFYYEKNWSDSTVRRFIIRVGYENFDDLIELRKADIYGMHAVPIVDCSPTFMLLAELRTRIEKCQESNSAMSIKDLAVNGNDLMELNIPAGKALGAILRELFEVVTDSPEMNDREKLIECAKKIWTTKYCPD